MCHQGMDHRNGPCLSANLHWNKCATKAWTIGTVHASLLHAKQHHHFLTAVLRKYADVNTHNQRLFPEVGHLAR